MSIVTEKYSTGRINTICQLLTSQAETGQPKEYDVRVDELKVVSRTADPEQFHNHEDFVQPDTRSITICLYEGASRRCLRYVLLLKEEVSEQKSTLAGIDQSISEKISQERSRWDYEQLQKENADLKEKLEEAEEYAGTLEESIETMKAEKASASSRLTETLVGFAGMYLNSNPKALDGIPLLKGLMGGSAAAGNSGNNNSGNDTAASFAPKTQAPTQQQTEEVAETSSSKMQPKRPYSPAVQVSQGEIENMKASLIPFFPADNLVKVSDIICLMYRQQSLVQEMYELIAESMEALQAGNEERLSKESITSKAKEPAELMV